MERTRETSKQTDGRRRESCVQKKHLERRTAREREREKERSKGTSWREQGG